MSEFLTSLSFFGSDRRWAAWTIVVLLGLPLSMVLLEKMSDMLRRAGDRMAGPVMFCRNVVAPTVAVLILLREVLRLPSDQVLVRIVTSIVGLVVVYASLSLLNAFLARWDEDDASLRSARQQTVPAVNRRTTIPSVIRDLIRMLLVALGAIVVLQSVWKIDVRGLFTALGVTSIVLGLALQDPLGNVLSGVALMCQRPFRVGDWIRAGVDVGVVKEVTWRAVLLQTLQNEMKIVPNASLAKVTIGNFSRVSHYTVETIPLKMPASVAPNQVRERLIELARAVPGVLAEPAPVVVVQGIDGGNIQYQVRFSVGSFEEMESARSVFLTRLWYFSRRSRSGIPPVGGDAGGKGLGEPERRSVSV